MHFLIASLTCCAFVLIGARAEDAERVTVYNCTANVPQKAAEALLKAINGKRAVWEESGLKLPTIGGNDCDLAEEAFTNIFGTQNHRGFEIKSAFDDKWEEKLRKKVLSATTNGMINAANRVGCGIKLKTSETDGSHHIEVECAFGV